MGQSVDVVVSELHSASARLADAAQRLTDGLAGVDDETAQLLGSDWKGGAASAYAPVWKTWHDGAAQVVEGLQRMSELLTIAGKEYAKTDESASDALDSTVHTSGGGAGGAGADTGAGQVTGPAEGVQRSMASAMQLGEVAGQPLSHVGQAGSGLGQTIAALAQQAAQIATGAVEQAEAADGNEDQQSPDSTPAGRADAPNDQG